MTLTAPEIYTRLTEMDSDETNQFTLASGTTEADVQTWYDGLDIQSLETTADANIERTAVTDLQAPASIGADNLSVAEVIKSRNDTPADFDAAYILRADRTFVQYFKPDIGGKKPITSSEVQTVMDNHVQDLISKVVSSDLLSKAQTKFGA